MVGEGDEVTLKLIAWKDVVILFQALSALSLWFAVFHKSRRPTTGPGGLHCSYGCFGKGASMAIGDACVEPYLVRILAWWTHQLSDTVSSFKAHEANIFWFAWTWLHFLWDTGLQVFFLTSCFRMGPGTLWTRERERERERQRVGFVLSFYIVPFWRLLTCGSRDCQGHQCMWKIRNVVICHCRIFCLLCPTWCDLARGSLALVISRA